MSTTTLESYRKILNTSWRPFIDALPFLSVPYSTLIKVADVHKQWGKKNYNNSVQTMWCVYSAWMRDAVDSDADVIRYAMERGPDPSLQRTGLSRGTPAIAAASPPNPAPVDSSASASGFLALARTARDLALKPSP